MALMSALSTAVTGLKSQQTALDVIANNIANVNTPGYKSQTVSFSDILSQTISSASAPTATTGGVNAMQVGLGTQVSSINTDLTVGTASATSNSTDIALNGAGYLIVKSDSGYLFTRDGSLSIDLEGNVTINGYKVCGWEAYTPDSDGNIVYNTDGTVEPLNIYSDSYSGNKQNLPAKATSSASVTGTVDSSAKVISGATMKNIGSTPITDWDATTGVDVVDEQGNTTEVKINLKKCATDGTTTSWYWEASGNDATISPSSGYIAFDSSGNMITSYTPLTATLATTTTGYSDGDINLSSGLTTGNYTISVADSTTTGYYDITLTDPSGKTYTATSSDGSATFKTSSGTITLSSATLTSGTTDTFTVAAGTPVTFDSTPAITVLNTTDGTNATTVKLDLSKIRATSSSDASLTSTSDGYEAGTAQSYSISSDGTISATYSNGETRSVGQIALAVFSNPGGLEKTGNNFYKVSTNSGDYQTVVAGTGGSGAMRSYALELSNVDLAAQFSAMMISQRAYQANSKIISTSDDILQTLVNMVGR